MIFLTTHTAEWEAPKTAIFSPFLIVCCNKSRFNAISNGILFYPKLSLGIFKGVAPIANITFGLVIIFLKLIYNSH